MRIERVSMVRALFAGVWLCCWLSACTRVTTPDPNGQTHWLKRCEASEECGELSCLCGVCAIPCKSNAECNDHLDGAQCSPATAEANLELCGNVTAQTMCLKQCSEKDGCSNGQNCVEGACIPKATMSSIDSSVPGDGEIVNGREIDAQVPGGPVMCTQADAATESNDVVFSWVVIPHAFDFSPYLASYVGDDLSAFQLALRCAPPKDVRYVSEILDGGVPASESTEIAIANIYQITPGALVSNRDGVIALDESLVVGYVNATTLFWTSRDIESVVGVPHLTYLKNSGPFSAGYHLFQHGKEVPIDTVLTMGTEIHDGIGE
jgi:hypothetical protein